jgi:hypothetical protein
MYNPGLDHVRNIFIYYCLFDQMKKKSLQYDGEVLKTLISLFVSLSV